MPIAVIILSGGRSSRFDGIHKPGVELGGQTVISRLLDTTTLVDPGAEVIVSGPTDGLSDAQLGAVQSVRETPLFSGPLAGIAAACTALETKVRTAENAEPEVIVVLAGDMPLVSAEHLNTLVRACRETGRPATATDDRGKLQFLCTAWPMSLIRSRLADIGDPTNKPAKLLFDGLSPALVEVDPDIVTDFDTQDEFSRIRARLGKTQNHLGGSSEPPR